jgi:hypothetical protein
MLNFTVYGASLYAPCKFIILDLLLSSSFGSRAACELARASSLTKRAKIVDWLVINLTEPSLIELSYK